MSAHPKKERTFVILKPDTIQRSLVGEIVSRFERAGLKIVGMRFGIADEKKLWSHYNKDDAWFEKKGSNIVNERKERELPVEKAAIEYGKDIIGALVKFMTAGPVLMLAIEGNQSIAVVKKLVGGTEPATSDVGTIRGDYTSDSYAIAAVDDRAVRNLVHCSDNPDDAKREVALWFEEKDLLDYTIVNEAILYDINLDGIME
jgi:nucleoside-diphosphate kinase